MSDVAPSGAARDVVPAARTRGMYSSRLRELVGAAVSGRVLSLAGGLPPERLLAYELVRDATEELLVRHRRGLQYSVTEGELELRQHVVAASSQRWSRTVDAGQCLVTTGSQQALDLVGKVLLDRGDLVVVESPAYVGALRAFAAYEPTVVEVRTDAEGFDVDALEALLAEGARPKLCYLVSNFSNPGGHSTSGARRQRLAALADRHGFLVVEDDPYRALRFTGTDEPDVAAFGANVLYLGSFSKVIAPGLRVGFALGPAWLMRLLSVAKQAADLNSSALNQLVVLHILQRRSAELALHIEAVRSAYADNAAALLAAADEHLDGVLTLRAPTGGMFAWANLEPDLDALAFAQECLRRGVAVVPGDEFSLGASFAHELRLSFSLLEPQEFGIAALRMRQAADALRGTGRH